MCLNVCVCETVELLAVIQHDCQPRQSVSSHSGTFSWSKCVSACVQTCVTVPLRSSEHRAKGQTDRQTTTPSLWGAMRCFFFFFFGSERLKLQDSSGITAGQKVSVQPAESPMGRHQSTLFLHFFFASFLLFLLYLNRIMDSLLCFQEHRLQTTDYFLLLVKCI